MIGLFKLTVLELKIQNFRTNVMFSIIDFCSLGSFSGRRRSSCSSYGSPMTCPTDREYRAVPTSREFEFFLPDYFGRSVFSLGDDKKVFVLIDFANIKDKFHTPRLD